MAKTLFIIWYLFLVTGNYITFADIHLAKTASYDDVLVAYNEASAGDIVKVPAGEAVWTSTLSATQKGVWFEGAGIDKTIIHQPSGTIFYYRPTLPGNNDIFKVSGFTFDGNGTNTGSGMVYVVNHSTIPVNKISIFQNKFRNTKDSIYIQGAVYGVAYLNEFDSCKIVFRGLGSDRISWDNHPFSYGSADNFYFEDNNIYFTTITSDYPGWVEGGQGGRFCLRYNTWNLANTTGFLDCLDIHGNQKTTGESYATMGAEVYGNIWTNGRSGRWMYQRGGRLLMFNNLFTGTGGQPYIGIAEEYNDALSPTNGSQIQHVSDSYFWNNHANGINISASISSDYGSILAANREFWNYTSSFNGSSGVGCGSNEPTMNCEKGVGFWKTSYTPASTPPANMTDLKTYCQSGFFYKAIASNSWNLYYKPYTYPHPLRTGLPMSVEPPLHLRIKK